VIPYRKEKYAKKTEKPIVFQNVTAKQIDLKYDRHLKSDIRCPLDEGFPFQAQSNPFPKTSN
jgi:hypothetical protein